MCPECKLRLGGETEYVCVYVEQSIDLVLAFLFCGLQVWVCMDGWMDGCD